MFSGNSGDLVLIKALKEGHQEALATLYDNYSPALYGFILRIVGNSDLADIVLQQSFISIWNSINTYDVLKEPVITWMLKITMHTAIYALPVSDAAGNKEAVTERSDINYLNDAITLIFFKGLKLEEASSRLEIPLNTLIPKMKMAFKQLNGELPL